MAWSVPDLISILDSRKRQLEATVSGNVAAYEAPFGPVIRNVFPLGAQNNYKIPKAYAALYGPDPYGRIVVLNKKRS